MPIHSEIVQPGDPAPSFTLFSLSGEEVSLDQFLGQKNVVLVFLRGFLWPFCRRHLEQLRQDYHLFEERDTEIVVIAPDTMMNAQSFFEKNPVPFTALVDNSLEVYQQYDVQSKLISLGQRPGLFIIDKQGIVQFAYIGGQQWEIPTNAQVLEKLDELEKLSV